MKIDFKKTEKTIYQPKQQPSLIEMPELPYLMIDGQGDPNTSSEYALAVEALYAIAYTIRMSHKGDETPVGYFEYVVPPLEGLWWDGAIDLATLTITDKAQFSWTMMIRQPEFVTAAVFAWAQAKAITKSKGANQAIVHVRWESYREGLCVQMLHVGPYDDEAESIRMMDAFVHEHGYTIDIGEHRKHHEVYLSDPRKVAPEKLKTIIRHPIR